MEPKSIDCTVPDARAGANCSVREIRSDYVSHLGHIEICIRRCNQLSHCHSLIVSLGQTAGASTLTVIDLHQWR